VNNEEWINSLSTIHWAGQVRPSPKWLGRVWPNPIFFKKIHFKIFLWLSHVFFYQILFNTSLYFYTVKIQIRY
jgi:hypothetical protein